MISPEFLLTALVVVLVPGTGVVYTVAAGLGRGRLASIAAASGCTLGIVPHIFASVLGLAAILHTSAILFTALKYAGAAYLIYLAWQTLHAKGPLKFKPVAGHKSAIRIVRTGFLINILNPKLSIFFLAFLPQFIPVGAQDGIWLMVALGGIFMAMTLTVFILYGLFAAWVRQAVLNSVRAMAWMRRITAGILTALGVRLAFANA